MNHTDTESAGAVPIEIPAENEGASKSESVASELPLEASASPGADRAASEASADAGATVPGDEPKPVAPPQQKARPKPDPQMEERRLRAQANWDHVVRARESGTTVPGTVTATVNGGLLVDVGGIRGFLPASQVHVPIGTSLESLVKTSVQLKVIDIDANRRRIVVSQRRAVEEERRAKRTELLKSLRVGLVLEGTVMRLTDFGAFIDIGGIDGLVPMSELAFDRVDKASDVLTVGEKITVAVLRIDEGGKKIALSRKNALPDPWRDHGEVLRTGNVVEGKVVAKEPRLQVEIAPGVIGSVRESDADPAEYAIGEAIEVAVRSIDRRTRRIVLTTMHGAAATATTTTSSGFAPLGIELKRS